MLERRLAEERRGRASLNAMGRDGQGGGDAMRHRGNKEICIACESKLIAIIE